MTPSNKQNLTAFRERQRSEGLVQLYRHITPEQKSDFVAVLEGRASVVYNPGNLAMLTGLNEPPPTLP
jgi:hypothetical protein